MTAGPRIRPPPQPHGHPAAVVRPIEGTEYPDRHLATARSCRTIFFLIFLVPRKVHDSLDFNSRFGRRELKTAGRRSSAKPQPRRRIALCACDGEYQAADRPQVTAGAYFGLLQSAASA
jgi:hypothetical protein